MSAFTGNILRWPFNRTVRQFVVRVVEPLSYKPDTHADLFNAVLEELLATPSAPPVDRYDSAVIAPKKIWFDLVTFPEAFLPADTLVAVLSQLIGVGSFGCIHVGLRPSNKGDTHLFNLIEIRELLRQIYLVPSIKSTDVDEFKSWINAQNEDDVFNIGCVFLIDAQGELRVCLHPKLVRSKFETDVLPERHMKEADFLTLITLEPTDKRFSSITIQPIICSDALDLPTDRLSPNPLVAVNRDANCFGESLPDHVDVVTVATCTPQTKGNTKGGSPYRQWHGQFLDTFRAVASKPDYGRHHCAVIVLANFTTIESHQGKILEGGVSGIFMPVPPPRYHFHADVSACCWGRIKNSKNDNNWSTPDDLALENWDSKGFVAGLNPYAFGTNDVARIFGFTVQRLPRESSLWSAFENLTKCTVSAGKTQNGSPISFQKVNANVSG